MNIKKNITATLLSISAITASAAITGKTYTPGDTIIIRGNKCLVISTDQTGEHGKAILPPAADQKSAAQAEKIANKYEKKAAKKMAGKTPDELIAESEKNLEKLVKQGIMTRQQADETLAQMRAGFATSAETSGSDASVDIETAMQAAKPGITTQPLTFESGKNGQRTYLVKEWSSTLPEGFRLTTSDDARDIVVTLVGGMGPAHSFTIKSALEKTRNFCSDLVFSNSLYMILRNGFIVCDDMSSQDVRFCKPEQVEGITTKQCMEISSRWRGEEYTIALSDF